MSNGIKRAYTTGRGARQNKRRDLRRELRDPSLNYSRNKNKFSSSFINDGWEAT